QGIARPRDKVSSIHEHSHLYSRTQPSLRPRRYVPKIRIQLFCGVESGLFVRVAVLAAANVLGRADKALLNPTVERPESHTVALSLGGPRFAALPRILL